LVEQRIRNA